MVGGGADHNGTLGAFRPHVVLEERADLAIALADQGDDGDVGGVVAGHGSEQGALTHAAAAENPHALPFAAERQRVDGPNAGDDRLGDVLAVERASGWLIQAILRAGLNFRSVIEGTAKTVQDPSDQAGADRQARFVLTGDDAIVQLHPVDFLQRHREHMPISKPDDLGANAPARRRGDLAEVSHGDGRSLGSDEDADDLGHLPGPRQELGITNLRDVGTQIKRLGAKGLGAGHERSSRWSARPCSISRSCVSTEASKEPRLISKTAPPRGCEASLTTSISGSRPICWRQARTNCS